MKKNLKESLDMKKNIGFNYNRSSLVPYSQIPQASYSSFDDYLGNDPQARHMINQGFDLRGLGELLDDVLNMGQDIGLDTARQIAGGASPMDAAKITIARELVSFLQPEIDKIRDQNLDKINKSLLEVLPKIKVLIEKKGTASSRKLVEMIDAKLKSLIPFSSKKKIKDTDDQEGENLLLSAIPNEDVFVDLASIGISPDIKLKLANPRQMFDRVYNKDMQNSLEKNVVVPMQGVIDKEVVKPLKKRAVIVGSSIFALGALTALGSVWAYMHFKGKKEKDGISSTNTNIQQKQGYSSGYQTYNTPNLHKYNKR